MEARVWSDPEVLEILRNDYVICALYSDDKKVLPEEDWVTTDAGKSQESRQDQLLLRAEDLRCECTALLRPAGPRRETAGRAPRYNLDVEAFVQFLRSGVEAYKKQ